LEDILKLMLVVLLERKAELEESLTCSRAKWEKCGYLALNLAVHRIATMLQNVNNIFEE